MFDDKWGSANTPHGTADKCAPLMTAPFTVAVTRTARRSEGGWFVQPEYCSSVIVNVREVLEVSMRTLMALSQATLNDPHSLRTRNYSHVDSAFVIVSWVVSVLSLLSLERETWDDPDEGRVRT